MTSLSDTFTQTPIEQVAAFQPDDFENYAGEHSLVLFYRNCNLKCKYCYNTEIVNTPTDKCWDPKAIINLHKDSLHTAIVFSGGEPTLCKTIVEDIEYAKSLGFKTKLFTNGLNMSVILKCLKHLDAISIDLKCINYTKILGVGGMHQYPQLIKSLVEAVYTKSDISIDIRTTLWDGIDNKEKHELLSYAQDIASIDTSKRIELFTQEQLEY